VNRYLITWTALLVCTLAHAEDWKVLHSDKFGFMMLLPRGAAWVGTDWGYGWGGCRVSQGVYQFGAMVKLDAYAGLQELEGAAVMMSRVPAAYWSLVDDQRDTNGWIWRRTYMVQYGDRALYAVLGTGPRGSYVLFMETTLSDLMSQQALYRQWYDSLTVY
jgi:hypothetical protein